MEAELLVKVAELFRRLTLLEKLVYEELKEDVVDLDARVDGLSDTLVSMNSRMDKLTNTMSALMLMTGGVERSVDRLTAFMQAHSNDDLVRQDVVIKHLLRLNDILGIKE